MEKIDILRKLRDEKLVAVIRSRTKQQALKSAIAAVAGGIKFIEITFTTPSADEIIRELTDELQEQEVVIGAGTVLEATTARIAMLAGAKFIVSPVFNEDLVKMVNLYRVPIMTGALTPLEAVQALELGVDIIKIFPGDAYQPSIIKSFKGPMPQANFMPTGGVNLENIHKWLEAGAFAVGTGSSLTVGAQTENYQSVTSEAEKFVNKVKTFKEGK
ncbi:bifunctional 2-keto-4-hydroxyglutarate aldolase/2-keto-3-deoxy-6-phosphogluconate aldolase [Enterococcus sp. LJL120]